MTARPCRVDLLHQRLGVGQQGAVPRPAVPAARVPVHVHHQDVEREAVLGVFPDHRAEVVAGERAPAREPRSELGSAAASAPSRRWWRSRRRRCGTPRRTRTGTSRGRCRRAVAVPVADLDRSVRVVDQRPAVAGDQALAEVDRIGDRVERAYRPAEVGLRPVAGAPGHAVRPRRISDREVAARETAGRPAGSVRRIRPVLRSSEPSGLRSSR